MTEKSEETKLGRANASQFGHFFHINDNIWTEFLFGANNENTGYGGVPFLLYRTALQVNYFTFFTIKQIFKWGYYFRWFFFYPVKTCRHETTDKIEVNTGKEFESRTADCDTDTQWYRLSDTEPWRTAATTEVKSFSKNYLSTYKNLLVPSARF